MSQNEQGEQREFEEEVRTVARALWPSARFGGVENIGNTEYDGVFPAFDTIHCVEATVSRRADKARHDGEKLRRAINHWTGRDERLAKGWFITKNEPTPEQTEVIRKIDQRITAISFKRFKARLVDVYLYSQLRQNMQFGSAVNPDMENDRYEPYVSVSFGYLDGDAAPKNILFSECLDYAVEGKRLAIIGDYGIGKSMNLRELYLRLTAKAKENRALNVPIHINLRNHWGQKSPSAAITQHAEEIGYPNPQQLIAAWRAGFIHVLLDGFDEVAAPGWSGNMASLRSSRRRAVELVRQFVDQTPRHAAVVVAGRRSYFDSIQELRSAIFGYHPHLLLELNEFDNEQIDQYLKTKKINRIPDWLPARPLLLGHLAARKLFETDIAAQTESMTQAESWDWLLDIISQREASIEAGLSGEIVREIIEGLASQARKSSSGIGPLTQREITDTFLKLRGQEPSDSEQAILQRLPGLARDPDFEEGTRSFIDADFASAAQARGVSNIAINPFSQIDEQAVANWNFSLDALGIEVAAQQYSTLSSSNGQLTSAFRYAKRKDLYVALADLTRMSIVLGYSIDEPISIHYAYVPNLTLFDGMPNISSVAFSGCLFGEIEISDRVDESNLPQFNSCYIESVLGRFGASDLPTGVFSEDCDFGQFPDSPDRNAAVMSSGLPVGVRVAITILRKLYMQPGRGRLESALSRGMDQNERVRVGACLSLLQREKLTYSTRIQSRKIWLPNRSSQVRALKFIEAPRGSGDPLYGEASKL